LEVFGGIRVSRLEKVEVNCYLLLFVVIHWKKAALLALLNIKEFIQGEITKLMKVLKT